MDQKHIRQLVYYRHHFYEFYEELSPSAKAKFKWALDLICSVQRIPSKYLRYLHDTLGLYEIRVEVGSDIYRLFCLFDRGNLVVLMNGFKKKSQKPPKIEIALAIKLMKEYEKEKSGIS
jgi:phage-related protein